jgi:predicted nucleic acid-binding protein
MSAERKGAERKSATAALHGKLKAAVFAVAGEPKGAREFVDTNVLVYAFDTSAGDKHALAKQLLARPWETERGCLSVQVLAEFFVTVTHKTKQPLGADEAAERVREFATWKIFRPGAEDVLAAITLHRTAQLSFWDALIVESAREAGCALLWTEDLNHGQTVRGVEIRNPFR